MEIKPSQPRAHSPRESMCRASNITDFQAGCGSTSRLGSIERMVVNSGLHSKTPSQDVIKLTEKTQLLKRLRSWTSEMAQWVKALVAKLDKLI